MTATATALRLALEPLDWADRFERLATEERGADPGRKAAIAALRDDLADEALTELAVSWGGIPLKEGVLRLPSKRMRGALGRAAKRARDRRIVDVVGEWRRTGSEPLATGERGRGMDERVLEIPLALAAARLHEPGEVLDAGSALNLEVVRRVIGRPAAVVTHFTLPGAVEPEWPGDADRYRRQAGDLRALPFGDGAFHRVVCVSTLEHVGLDTGRFGAPGERAPDTAPRAVAELARVLAPGGTLFATVPYGQAADHGWFRVFDAGGLAWLLSPLAALDVCVRYFFYENGWIEGTSAVPPSLTPSPYTGDVITGVAIVHAVKRSGA